MAFALYFINSKNLLRDSLCLGIVIIPLVKSLACILKGIKRANLLIAIIDHKHILIFPGTYAAINHILLGIITIAALGIIQLSLIGCLHGLLELVNVSVNRITLSSIIGLSKPYPANSSTFTGITKVDNVTHVPRLDGRYSERNLALVFQTISGVTHACAVYSAHFKRDICVGVGGPIQNIIVFIIGNITIFIYLDSLTSICIIKLYSLFKVVNSPLKFLSGHAVIYLRIEGLIPSWIFILHCLLVVIRILGILLLLNLNLIGIYVAQHLLLGKCLGSHILHGLKPLTEAHPLVFTGFQAALALDHGQPLVRRSLLLLDVLYGLLGVAYEDVLVGVGYAETDIIFPFIKTL